MHLGGAREGVASAEARRVIDLGPADAEQVVMRSQALTGLERLEIYNRAYYARLLECLREEFTVLRHAFGEEAFDEFAVAYLQKYQSRSYTLNQLGANFPRYLAESRPEEDGAGWPQFLIDLAALERTYGEVFDGPGVEGERLVEVSQVLAIQPARWPEARLQPVPCLRLLRLRYPVHRYYTAVRKNQNPPYPRPRTTNLAVTRRDFVVRRYPLSRVQYALLEALAAGQPVGRAVGAAAGAAGPDLDRLAADLHKWFYNWTAEGFFRAVELPG
jgi:hypothetical protein